MDGTCGIDDGDRNSDKGGWGISAGNEVGIIEDAEAGERAITGDASATEIAGSNSSSLSPSFP